MPRGIVLEQAKDVSGTPARAAAAGSAPLGERTPVVSATAAASAGLDVAPTRTLSRAPLWMAASVLLLGLGLSLLGAWTLREQARERERLYLQQQASAKVRQFELALQLALESLTSVRAFHDASGVRDAQQFERFVRSDAAFRPGTLALGWAPRIDEAGRPAFEAWLTERNGQRETIFEATGHGLKRAVALCADCYPLQYLTALGGADVAPGVNLASLPTRAHAIAAALASGKAGATKVRRADAWGEPDDLVVQVFLPVWPEGPRPLPDATVTRSSAAVGADTVSGSAEAAQSSPRPVAGLAMGVFNLTALLSQVFDAQVDPFNLTLFDVSAPAAEQRLYSLRGEGAAGDLAAAEVPNDFETARARAPTAVVHAFSVADRQWVALFSAPPRASATAWLVPLLGLGGGLLITAMLAIYLFIALARGRQLAQLSGRLVEQQVAVALERAQRLQAQSVASARSSFLQAASHDLRQPLHALGLYLGVLTEQPAAAHDGVLMRRLQQSAGALHALFDALLDLGRLESGHMAPDLRAFDLAPLVERLGQEVQAQAQRSGLRLLVRAAPVTVLSDPLLVERIVRNLLINALRYTPSGWVALRVVVRGARAEVQVMDSGPGIAQARRAHIFQPYVRDAQSADGLGLGLAIVQSLSEELGAPLRLRSRVGRGSVFALSLQVAADAGTPAPSDGAEDPTDSSERGRAGSGLNGEPHAKDPLDAAGLAVQALLAFQAGGAAAAPSRAGGGPLALTGLQVLLLDDDSEVLAATSGLLRAWGAAVQVARTVTEADRLWQASAGVPQALGLLLLDQRLPDGTGCAWLAARRAEGCDWPAIVITADATPALREAALAVGAVLASKPLTPLKLRAVIGAALQASRRADLRRS